MKKILILILSFLSLTSYGQAEFEKIQITQNVASPTATRVNVQEADGVINYVTGNNIPIPYIPLNYSVLTPTTGGHFAGIDSKLGTLSSTTAGVTTRVWFTADVSVVSATNYYATGVSKGTTASATQSVVNTDNEKKYFTQDLIGAPFATATMFPPGVYAGNLSASTSPNSAQQRYTAELYKCTNAGVPVNSGVVGEPIGSLGVQVITILDSGLLTLADGSVTNVTMSGNLTGTGLSILAGERIRYHVSAEKVGTAGANITQSVYYGTSYNSFIDVPVPLNTNSVVNLSTVSGATTTDALNTLNTNRVSGSGLANYVTRWVNTNTVGTGALWDDGTSKVGINKSNPQAGLDIDFNGTVYAAIKLNNINVNGGSGSIQFFDNGVSKWNLTTDSSNNYLLFNQDGAAAGQAFKITKATGVVQVNSLAGTGTRQVVADASGNLSATTQQPLKYVALLTQSGTSAPTATVLENTLGGTVVWTRSTTGQYVGTLAGTFTNNKTWIVTGNEMTPSSVHLIKPIYIDANSVQILTIPNTGGSADTVLSNTAIEIRVYP